MASTAFAFRLNLPPHRHPPTLLKPRTIIICSSAGWDREEARWLREEQRWLREEQRWMRQESRWISERDALRAEVEALRRKVEDLEHRSSLPVMGRIAESGSVARRLLLEEGEVEVEKVVVVEEEVRISESAVKGAERGEGEMIEEKGATIKRALRMGSEGEDVRKLQEALELLGFYSGDEDMEFSSFSSGTQRAVKTWQASLGSPEDGVMTVELLGILHKMIETGAKVEKAVPEESLASQKMVSGDTNGAPVASVTKISETKKMVGRDSESQFDVSQQRVFLLGENRWEEPSRLNSRKNESGKNVVVSDKKCLSCRGEGRLMCAECDGSGEPNIEPQFLEWVDEDAKCPYCEGLGYTICDVCNGKPVV